MGLPVLCLFKRFLHIPCPGCGMTRAVVSLIRFDFASACHYHPCVFIMPLVVLLIFANGKIFKKKWVDNAILVFVLAAFLLTYIIRLILWIDGNPIVADW